MKKNKCAKSKTIFTVCYDKTHENFVKRFLEIEDLSIIAIGAMSPSPFPDKLLYLDLQQIYKKRKANHKLSSRLFFELSNSIEVLIGRLTLDEVIDRAKYLLEEIESIDAEEFSERYAFIWMPDSYISKVLSECARVKGWKVAYLELSNFPGRLQFDPCGINSDSVLAQEFSECFEDDKSKTIVDEALKFVSLKIEEKKCAVIPQLSEGLNWLDHKSFINKLKMRRVFDKRFISKIPYYLIKKIMKICISDKNVPYDFAFFPAQVSEDSQLVIRSRYSNLRAVLVARVLAKKSGLSLLVKPHPAETNGLNIFILWIYSFFYGYRLTNRNTYKLIEECSFVIANNSTVAQESILMDKKVFNIGQIYFSDWSKEKLACFIYNWLLKFDLYSTRSVQQGEIEDMLKRCRRIRS